MRKEIRITFKTKKDLELYKKIKQGAEDEMLPLTLFIKRTVNKNLIK